MTPAEQRRWHRAFIEAIGHRRAAEMIDSDQQQMRGLRSAGVNPTEAAATIRLRLYERHGR